MLQKKEKPSRNQLNAHAPHIQEQCQQLICLNAGGTAAIVGSWCLVPAGHGSLLQLQSSGWAAEKLLWSRREGMALPPHTLLPPPVSGCLPHIPPEAIMGNDAKRGAWMGQTNYRDNRQRATWGSFPWWGRKYELDIHELSQGPFPPAALYIQLRRTAKQNGSKNVHRWKKLLSTIHQAANCALLCGWDMALWGHLLSTMNPITVVSTIGQSVWNHSLHLRTCAHNCPTLLSCFIRYKFKLIDKLTKLW